MLRGVLKPMPEYVVHYRAGVEIPKHGIKFVVDEDAKKDFHVGDDGVLTMSAQGYKYMKAGSGQHVVIEPLDAPADAGDRFEAIEGLRAENEALHDHRVKQEETIAELSKAHGAASDERDKLRAQLEAAHKRVAELEAAAKPKK